MFFVYLFVGIAVLVGLLFLVGRFLRNVQPDEGEIERDLKELKASVAQYKGGFAEWNEGISASDINQILDKKNHRSGKGVFTSPSGDPVFAFAFRNYIGPGKNALLYILSNDHEYVFRTTTKGTEVTIDNQKIGLIRSNGTLYDIRNNEVATVKRHGATSTNTVILNNKEVAKIALPDSIAKIEAVEITGVDLSAEDTQTVRTLAVFELVNNMGDLEA